MPSTPRIMLMVVVLPAPLGPTRPTISPGQTWKVIPSTARTSAYVLQRPSTDRIRVGLVRGWSIAAEVRVRHDPNGSPAPLHRRSAAPFGAKGGSRPTGRRA